MDTKQLERFCPWARRELIDAVGRRCVLFGLDDKSRLQVGPDADIVNGTVLTQAQKAQRSSLYSRIESMGYEAFCEAEAYGWFNRFAAIRYMELHGFLPSRVRMLSGVDGSFDPQCLRVVGELDLPGLDVPATLQLIVQNQADDAYRDILVAQCNELADCLPEVFGRVGGSDALTLPDGLLLRGEHDFLYHLVTDIPESDWQDVEVLGWMYQFYNSERKEDFFKSKRKATAADIAPATQLFTPEWIVRYMVENSLGRLWMLNRPGSRLRDRMEYYIEPDAEHEDFIRIESPEDITLCDPACGSGHILSYSFELLFAIYEECGYTAREIPELILTKNLSGYEVDPRAAQIASLVLALRAREHDRRFFRRDVRADVRVLESVPLEEGEAGVPKELTEELTHLGEVGSLLAPTDADVEALRAGIASCKGDLFAAATKDRLERALEACEALRRRFDVVAANPPYMGSSSFNPFMSGWVKRNYSDVKSDLCTCFIERGYGLAKDRGYSVMVTMQSWMFLGSFEKMRNKLIAEKGIVTMAHLGPRAFDAIGGEVVSVTADVLYNGRCEAPGTYFRLVDLNGSEPKRQALLEAIKNPACGWFYRRDASTFHQIPGSPIAYWASEAAFDAFVNGERLADLCPIHSGVRTGDNDSFLRFWWEVSRDKMCTTASSVYEAKSSQMKWFPCNKGGGFRRWFGNNWIIINWENDGECIRNCPGSDISPTRVMDWLFSGGLTWGTISSSLFSMRRSPKGFMFETKGAALLPQSNQQDSYLLGLLNSSVINDMQSFISPTLDYHEGPLGKLPVLIDSHNEKHIDSCVDCNVDWSRTDWDSFETSWDFKRSPLL
ncbi:BREX-1 system adenine-specific DNA-methyltransferase PglX [Paratractidigestivibacter faecalis]|uniref:BREX-1 system adenine-specific DNA-methyltransferase PglX n=1 Tax=Paratractidigestivibacter faecalis TaxID=2292441 RepID=UPI003F9C344E